MLSTFRATFNLLQTHSKITQKSLHLIKRTQFCCGHNVLQDSHKKKQNSIYKNSPPALNSLETRSSTLNSRYQDSHNLNSVQMRLNSINSHYQNGPALNSTQIRLYTVHSRNLNSAHLRLTENSLNENSGCKKYFLYQKRGHSTKSDQHRQKVVIETSSAPIEKLEFEKVMPLEKVEKSFWDKIDPYVKLARWDKPIGVYLLYWPCTWSIALATIQTGVDLETSLRTAALFLVGAGLMRGAGCTINDMWDKDIDRQVERTSDRPLASGAVSNKQALTFLALQLSAALTVLLQLNCFSVALGASSMLLVISYPLSKRVWNYPQLFLGATFNWGALLGYSAISGGLGLHTLPLYAGALAWTVVYDTIYAHQDKLDDARIGIKSTALTFGANTKPLLSAVLATSAAGLVTAGHMAGLSPVYDAAVAAYVVHVGRQIYTLDVDNPTDCAKKFKSNSLVGLIILLGIIGGGYNNYIENKTKNEGKNLRDNAKSCLFS